MLAQSGRGILLVKLIIACYLWCVGGIFFLFFLSTALLLSYCFPLHKIDPFLKWLLRLFFKALFINVKLSGRENLNPDQPYLFMVNHFSFLDVPLIGGFVPGYIRGIEAARQHKWPLYGLVMGRLGNIPIKRGNIHASISSMGKGLEYLSQNKSLVIFPEGGRTEDGLMKSFKKLPFHLAKKADIDIIPIGISGMFKLNNKTSLMMRPGTVHLKFGKPIPKEIITETDTLELRTLVREAIENLIS